MSIAQEFGETIPATPALQDRMTAAGTALPMSVKAAISHGKWHGRSGTAKPLCPGADRTPLRPIIRIMQPSKGKGGHGAFTARRDAKGRIQPVPSLGALVQGGTADDGICLE